MLDTIILPNSTTPGAYYLLFQADHNGVQAERIETNNTVALRLYVTDAFPDLTMPSVATNANLITVGDFLPLSSTIRNDGFGPAAGTLTGYYLSPIPAYSPQAVRIGGEYRSNLATNSSQSSSYMLTVPYTVSGGTYYLVAYADAPGLEPESDETNNTAVDSFPITVLGDALFQADLIPVQPSVGTASLVEGGMGTASCWVTNQGGVWAPPSQTAYYLSLDTVLDGNDLLLGSSTTDTLHPQDSSVQTTAFTIPVNTPLGAYYMLYVSDYGNAVVESDKSNNVAHWAITVVANPADLVVTQATAGSNSVFSGNTINVAALVRNQGSARIANTALGYYLSTDSLYDGSDVFLGSGAVDSLDAGDSSTQQTALTIPLATASGNYFILWYADYQEMRAEVDRSNNVVGVALAVVEPLPDLFSNMASSSPSTFAIGSSTTITTTLRNNGQASAGASSMGYYLSTDNVYSANDTLLATSNNAGLAVQGSAVLSTSITIPHHYPPGTYYILCYADYQQAQTESNENNNMTPVAITLTIPLPDLRPQNPTMNATTVAAGSTLNLSVEVENNSFGAASTHRLGYYLTTTPIFTTSAVLLSDTVLTGLAGNASSPQNATVTIPSNMPAGSYYLLFYVDDQQAVSERDESNNRMFYPFTVTPLLKPDVSIQSSTATTNSALVGTTVSTTCVVANTGNMAISTGEVGYYLSTTPTYNSNAVLLGSTPMGTIASNAVRTLSHSFSIPSSTAAGNYYLLFYADHLNAASESDETNNTAATAFVVTDSMPDLLVQNPSAILLNGQVQTTATVVNSSNRPSSSVQLGYFLSTDNVYDASDSYLGSTAVGALPAGLPDGTYYILFYADYLDEQTEQDETNNILAQSIQINVGLHYVTPLSMEVYPNPTDAGCQVELDKIYKQVTVRVYDAIGQLVETQQYYNRTVLPVSLGDAAGVYTLQLSTEAGLLGTLKVVKE